MFIIRCLGLTLLLCCFNVQKISAAENDAALLTHNTFTQELAHSSQTYKIAKSTFLPETYDDLGLSGRYNTKYDFNKNDCSGYPLSSCPTGASCIKCPFNSKKLRVSSCKDPYISSGSTCVCPAAATLTYSNDKCTKYCDKTCIAKTCEPSANETGCTNGTQTCNNGCGQNTRKCCTACTHTVTSKPANSHYTYSACKDSGGTQNVQTGWECDTDYHKVGEACEKDCIINNCSGYTLTSCPANGTCSPCTQIASNCSTDGTMYKLDSCASGYSKSGDTCIVKPTVEIGDILYSDLTTGKPENHATSGKTAIGVVFDVSKTLAIALENEKKCWYDSGKNLTIPNTYNSFSYKNDDNKGKEYTKTIVDFCHLNGKNCFAAEYSYLYKTEGTYIGDWYLPATGELELIYNNQKKLNDTLSLIKGKQLSNDKYWSSNTCSAASIWYRDFSKSSDEYGALLYAAHTIEYYVRPIIDYQNAGKQDTPIINVESELPYLYSDLTTSKEINKDKTIIGIVFNTAKKLAVALENSKDIMWASENFDIPNLNNYPTNQDAKADWNGKNNTQISINYCQSNNKTCPAINYAYAYKTEGTQSGDWYLPAAGELNELFAHYDEIDRSLNLLTKTNLPESQIWSSTESKCTTSTYCAISVLVQSAQDTITGQNKTTSSYISAVPIINYGNISKK